MSFAIPVVRPAGRSEADELVHRIVTSPSLRSRKQKNRAKKKVRTAVQEHRRYAKTNDLRAVALTLTFANSSDFDKKAISSFIDKVRRQVKKHGVSLPYAWVLERAHCLHYHLIIWLPRKMTMDKALLLRWWPWGSTWIEACQSVEAWTNYIVKFEDVPASSPIIPRGTRVFGIGGLDDQGKLAVFRACLPVWLRRLLPTGHRARRWPGGGWCDIETGEMFLSPWRWTPWGIVLCPRVLH